MKNYITWPHSGTSYSSKELCEQKEGQPCHEFDSNLVNPAALDMKDIQEDDHEKPIVEESYPEEIINEANERELRCTAPAELQGDKCITLIGYTKKLVKRLVECPNKLAALVDRDAQEQELHDLMKMLSSTDWMVVREAETGEATSTETKAERQAARQRISELRELLK